MRRSRTPASRSTLMTISVSVLGKGLGIGGLHLTVGYQIILQGCFRRQSRRSGSSPLKAAGKPVSAPVDSTLPLDELIQRFGMRLVPQRVPQHGTISTASVYRPLPAQ